MGGKGAKRKGSKFERDVKAAAQEYKLNVKKVALSGATEDYPGDIDIEGALYECKVRGDGFKELYKWLNVKDDDVPHKPYIRGLFVKADRMPPLAVVRMDDYLAMLACWHGRGEQ